MNCIWKLGFTDNKTDVCGCVTQKMQTDMVPSPMRDKKEG